MVPERAIISPSGRLLSPTPSSTYSGFGGGGGGGGRLARVSGGKMDSYGTVDGGGGGGGGLGGGISGKIKWWLDRGGAEEGGPLRGDGSGRAAVVVVGVSGVVWRGVVAAAAATATAAAAAATVAGCCGFVLGLTRCFGGDCGGAS